jgi:Mor family transcriptional regulator
MDEEVLRLAADKHKTDILEPFDEIMRLHGYEAISTFCECFGGSTAYIPSLHTIFKRCLEREAVNEYHGGNYAYAQLAHKYGFSERHLRKLVNGG